MYKNFKLVLISLFSLSISAFIWSVINFLLLEKLPTSYVYIKKEMNFYNIHLSKLFFHNTNIIIKNKKIETLQGIKLKALFENGKNSFIIIDDKKEIFLDLNQKYKGYKLIKVTNNSAIFQKNNKTYEIKLTKTKPTDFYNTPIQQKISKITIHNYIQNPKLIWNNIAINKTSRGYKISYIKKGSIFHKLGLQTGDYIIKINNQSLKTDADAWKIYKNINNFDELNLEIKRNNKIKDITYEIY